MGRDLRPISMSSSAEPRQARQQEQSQPCPLDGVILKPSIRDVADAAFALSAPPSFSQTSMSARSTAPDTDALIEPACRDRKVDRGPSLASDL
jgi:hypothetical protein